MSEENKIKKYFIKDEELFSIKEDKLNSKDITENLSMIIENTIPSYAIAVTGKSGIGKSSVINILKEKYDENSENYNIQKINIWRQDKSLKQILEESYTSIEEHNKKYSNIVNENITQDIGEILNIDNIKDNENLVSNDVTEQKENIHETKKSKKTVMKLIKFASIFLASFIITTLIFVLMEYFGNREMYNNNDVFFVQNTYLNYKENFLLISVFTIGLTAITYIISTIIAASKKSSQKTSYNNYQKNDISNNVIPQSQSQLQYIIPQNDLNSKDTTGFSRAKEMIITEKIKNTEKHNIEELEKATKLKMIDDSRKNIIIIEDVDKLTATKMLKTLEDVKHCKDYKNCILIIPFDEKVLTKAIEFRNQVKINANYRPLKFEKILDKVFEFKVFVPNISNGNIKDFALNLVKDSIPDFLDDYTDYKTFERVLRNVLIYKNVKTPRHVKKLVNNFINNKILIMNRVQSGKIDEMIVNDYKFDYQLAKMCVLQSDFTEFYDLLFKDFDYLEIFTSLCCMEINELREVYDRINEDLKPFFANKYTPLRDFLIQTKNYEIENMSILMYLTKIKIEKMFKDKSVYSYVIGEEDITQLRIQEVLELIKTLDSKQDVKEFTENNFAKLLEKYKENPSNIVYFTGLKDVIDLIDEYIDEKDYIKFLELVSENYNYYPQQALELLTNSQYEIPGDLLNNMIINIKPLLSKDNFDEIFGFLKDNSDPLFEDGNVSEYVHFLVNYIGLSSNPTSVIEELDDNFTRIGKIYELNKNVKGLENLDYNKTYEFLAKCLDNGELEKMVEIMNSILSDENSVQDVLNIEEKMSNYELIDIIEYNVDDIILGEDIEKVKLIENNYILLKNMIEICQIKQKQIQPTDTLKLVEKALQNISNYEYLVSIFDLLNKFDDMYFYELRKDFNEIVYACFHNSRSKNLKKAVIETTKYFKNTRLFKAKLTPAEEKFYSEN